MEYDLFISYKNENRNLVDFINQKFQFNGIVCFYDKRNIDKKLDEEIIRGIEKSKNYLVFLSKNITNDSYFSLEFNRIREKALKNDQIYYILFKVTKQEIEKIFFLPNYHIYEIKKRNELKDIVTKISKEVLINNLTEEIKNDKDINKENIIKDILNYSPELFNIHNKSEKEFSKLISNFFTYYEEITLEYLFNYFIEKQKYYFSFDQLLKVCEKDENGIYRKSCFEKNYLTKIKIDIEVKEKLTNNRKKKKYKKSIYETLFGDKNTVCLHAKNIYFKYKKNDIIKNFNITVKYGEVIAIIGQNGIGKTTLLKILAYLIYPSKGEIVYNFSKNKLTIKKDIQYFFDLPKINGNVNQYMKYLLLSNGKSCNEANNILTKLYKRFELEKYKDYKWKELSLGYRIKFLLVQIIILKPKLIILDEPLANIDKKMIKIFLKDLNEIAKRYQCSIIFSSHHIEDITSKNIDKVIIFNKNSKIKNINLKKLTNNHNTLLSIEVCDENEINRIISYLKGNLAIRKTRLISENRIYLDIDKEYKNQIINQLTNKFKITKLEDITTSSLRFYNEIF